MMAVTRQALFPAVILGLVMSAACREQPPVSTPNGPAADGKPSAISELSAGAAVRVITPRLPGADTDDGLIVYMGGLERGQQPTGVHDDLFARALVLTGVNGRTVGLVVLDLIGFFHDDVEAVRSELAERHPDVRLDYLTVASTHTHAGPDVIGLWTPIGRTVDDAYVAFIRHEAVEAVAAAWNARRPARMYVAQGSAPQLARDTRLPELIDDTVMALGLRDSTTNAGIATLVNWNSHPSVCGGENTEISADFPRAVVARMETDWGGTALYVSGDLGGQIGSGRVKIPDPLTGKTPDDRMRKAELIGDKIGTIALEALRSVAAQGAASEPTVLVRVRVLDIPMDNPRFAEGLAIGLIRPRRLYSKESGSKGYLPAELPDPGSLRAGVWNLRTEVAVVDIGPARWVMVPGELYPELALGGIQEPQDPGADHQGAPKENPLRPMSDRPLFLIGLANDELGYIIPKSQWDNEPPFAYGRDESQYGERNSTGPETAPLIMKAIEELLAKK